MEVLKTKIEFQLTLYFWSWKPLSIFWKIIFRKQRVFAPLFLSSVKVTLKKVPGSRNIAGNDSPILTDPLPVGEQVIKLGIPCNTYCCSFLVEEERSLSSYVYPLLDLNWDVKIWVTTYYTTLPKRNRSQRSQRTKKFSSFNQMRLIGGGSNT